MKGKGFWGIVSLITLEVSGVYIGLKAGYFMMFLIAVFTYSYNKLDDALSSEYELKNRCDN